VRTHSILAGLALGTVGAAVLIARAKAGVDVRVLAPGPHHDQRAAGITEPWL